MSKYLQLLLDPRYFPAGRVQPCRWHGAVRRLRTQVTEAEEFLGMRPLHRVPQDAVSSFHKEKSKREKWEGWGESQRDRQKDRETEGWRRKSRGRWRARQRHKRWKPQHCSGSNLKNDSITSAEPASLLETT